MTGPSGEGPGLLPPWLVQYRREWLRPDLVAGLTTAAVVVPKAMAYAAIAGLPVEIGLYTVLVPMLIYAVLGTSQVLSVSTTTTIAILTAAQLGEVAPGGDSAQLAGAAATLAFLVGLMLLAARLLRLGFLANFISEPVLTGFKAGIGLVIVVDQVPKLLGIHFQKGGFFQNVFSIVGHVPETSVPTLLVALAMLAIMVLMHRFVPRAPGPLVAVAAGIAASGLLGLQAQGVETIGNIPSGLPALTPPDRSLLEALWPAALGIALMSFTESIAAARAFAPHGSPRPNPNRELLGLGLANAAAGLFGAMPAGGGTSQTAVNRGAGARTQVAELVTAAVALATLLFLAPVIGLMPQAVLAAVVIATSVGLISPAEFRDIRRVRTMEFRWALIACAGVILLGTLKGILVAVIVSLAALLHQAQNPPVYALGRKRGTDVFRPLSREHPDDETFPGLLLLRTEGRIHFANAQRAGDKMWALLHQARPQVLVLDCGAVPDLEYTAVKMLGEAEERLREQGVTLWLAALNPEARQVIERSPLGARLGHERMFFNLTHAVETWQSRAAQVPQAGS